MAAMNSRRAAALTGALLAGIAILASISPAAAQIPPGSQAMVYVGGPVANCPPGSPGVLVPAGGTVNGVTLTGAGRCVPLSADAEGTYSVGGTPPLNFTSSCHNVGTHVQHGGGVQVPIGTRINGGAPVAVVTTVETLNTPVVFPNGRTAVLNVVSTTPTSLTRDAIVFGQGGPTVGRVVCGAAAYPLGVETAGASDVAAPLPALPASDGEGGGISTGLVAAGALALVVLAQVGISRRMRRTGDASA